MAERLDNPGFEQAGPPPPPEFEMHPFGEPVIEQYAPHPDGSVQFADTFDVPGTTIDWERHPYTSTYEDEVNYPGESMAHARQALIYGEDDSVYYLHGNRLYDIDRSAQYQSPSYVEFTEFTGDAAVPKRVQGAYFGEMPSVTIGERLPSTVGGKRVAGVLIATERVAAGDPFIADMHDVAEDGGPDPFKDVRDFLSTLGEEPVRDSRDPGVAVSREGLYDFASARTHDVDPNSEHSQALGGKKIPVATLIDREQGAAYPAVARNRRTGRRMSPTASPQEVDPGEYERVLDLVGDRIYSAQETAFRGIARVFGAERRQRRRHDIWAADVKRGGRPTPKRRLL